MQQIDAPKFKVGQEILVGERYLFKVLEIVRDYEWKYRCKMEEVPFARHLPQLCLVTEILLLDEGIF